MDVVGLFRSFRFSLLAVVIGSAQLFFGVASCTAEQSLHGRTTIRSIDFVDPQNGWAVGDRGLILRTHDGGRSWIECGVESSLSRQQGQIDKGMGRLLGAIRQTAGTDSSPIQQTLITSATVRLNSVSFADAQKGWAVGGTARPGLGTTQGQVLLTVNGGATWKTLASNHSPYLQRIKMDNIADGFSFGDVMGGAGTGIYQTRDSARAWSTNGVTDKRWQLVDGDRAGSRWVGVTIDGQLISSEGKRVETAVIMDRNSRPVRSVRMENENTGWAVGDGGTILKTIDGGLSWRAVEAAEGMRQELQYRDLNLVCIAGKNVFAAGSPGDKIIRIDSATSQMEVIPTGTAATLNSMDFVDAITGWCAGSDGTILNTNDGGSTWHVQRGGESNVALMMVAFDKENMWEVLASHAADEKLASVVVRILWRPEDCHDQVAFDEAVERVGAIQTTTIRAWKNLSPEKTDIQYVQERIATLIRGLRPQVVVGSSSRAMVGAESLDVHHFLDGAIFQAAGKRPSSNATVPPIAPWSVVRLWTPDAIGSGDWNSNGQKWLINIGRTASDHSLISRALAGVPLDGTGSLPWRMTLCSGGSSSGKPSGGFFGDINPDFSRRLAGTMVTSRPGTTADFARFSQKNSAIRRFAEGRFSSMAEVMGWRNEVTIWCNQVDEELAGVWLVQLAGEAMRIGNHRAAAEAINQLSISRRAHPMAAPMSFWLARYHASEEVRVANDQRIGPWSPGGEGLLAVGVENVPQTTSRQVVVGDGHSSQMVWLPDSAGVARTTEIVDDRMVELATALSEEELKITPEEERRSYWQSVAGLLTGLSMGDPAMENHKDILIAKAHAVRMSAGWEGAEPLYSAMLAGRTKDDRVDSIGRREKKINADMASLVDSIKLCGIAEQRPRLDGILDDPVWTSQLTEGLVTMLTAELPHRAGDSRTDYLMFAFDSEFLYFAGRCHRFGLPVSVTATNARQRDSIDGRSPRVNLYFDLDRDGAWPVWLSIGANGQLMDGVGHSKGWNPQWFVATANDDVAWSFEGAIAWKQLGKPEGPERGEIFGLSAERVMTAGNENCWNSPSCGMANRMGTLELPTGGAGDFWLLKME